ncbi:phosphomevalonate kinase [Tissierella creatinophila]|nr:phosphomevalonate kinase [Tissierella creatinophila]
MISSTSPGKLYIAGEYAVVEKGYPAIIVGVDGFITVSLEETKDMGSIKAYDNTPISFKRKDERLILDYRDNRLFYLINSINIVEILVKEMGKELKFYNLKVESELEDLEGKKYGLGSSAAVTISTIKVLCKFYGIETTKEKLFKLASLVHLKVNSNGSCGDIAASVYGGWISFKTFDKNWVLEKRANLTIKQLLDKKWPFLEIKRLTPPEDLNLLIGWTGRPSSTTILVDRVNKSRQDNSQFYKSFLEKSKACVENIIKAFEKGDLLGIQNGIMINRNLLVNMGQELGIQIETLGLSRLCDIALKFNGAAKSSGAGGGDCGIAIFNDKSNLEKLIYEWKKEGITHLPLKVYIEEELKSDQ